MFGAVTVGAGTGLYGPSSGAGENGGDGDGGGCKAGGGSPWPIPLSGLVFAPAASELLRRRLSNSNDANVTKLSNRSRIRSFHFSSKNTHSYLISNLSNYAISIWHFTTTFD